MLLPCRHVGPVNPLAHVHLNLPSPMSWHDPPFLQGLLAQGSTAFGFKEQK